MPRTIRKRPCRFCRKWFRPDPRVGRRQRACSAPDCQRRRRAQTQADWRRRNPGYFAAHRLAVRDADGDSTPPRLPAALARLPWDLAQDQLGIQGAGFIGLFGKVLLAAAKDPLRAYPLDSS
jgi:hypothetical protein